MPWNYDEAWVNNVMGPLFKSRYTQAGRTIGDDPGYAVWPSRTLYDITVNNLPPETSLAKHDRELCNALGITIPFPQPPDRQTLLNGRMTVQGVTIHTDQFGDIPWWPGCWAWLTQSDRAKAAAQLLALGDRITLVQYPDGRPLYDEPLPNFYNRDNFPALLWNAQQSADLVRELIGYGFAGVWVFMGGDGDYTENVTQARSHAQSFAAQPEADLNRYTVLIPCWDSVWGRGYGFSREQLASFADEAINSGAINIGCEHSTGYPLAGKGNADFQPGGVMAKYCLILGEFDDDVWDGGVWEILARYLPPGLYHYPGYLQPNGDDPPPHPYYLSGWSGSYRVFEYYIYGAVRGVPNATVAAAKARFVAMGATNVC